MLEKIPSDIDVHYQSGDTEKKRNKRTASLSNL